MKGKRLPLWANIILTTLGVLVCLAIVFLIYCGISSAFAGNGFVETMSDTWCTIFGLTQKATEKIVDTVAETTIQ